MLEVRLGRGNAEIGVAGDGLVAVLVVAVVVGGVLGGLDGHVLDVERAVGRHARAGGDGAVLAVEAEAALVQQLEAVGAGRSGLELVGVAGGGARRDDDVREDLAGGERERAGLGGEVLPRIGAQAHGAVVHGLGQVRALARAHDGEGVAAAADGERGMLEDGESSRLVRVAAGTVALLLAECRVGGGRDDRPRGPVVSERGDRLRLARATAGAEATFRARRRAGGEDVRSPRAVVVSEGGDFLRLGFAAAGAGVRLAARRHAGGRCVRGPRGPGMAEGGD